MKISIARLKEIIMEEVTTATNEAHDKDWGMGKDEKSRTHPGEEDYTGHKGDESHTHPGEEDYEHEGEPEPGDVEGHAERALKAIYDLASAAGVELEADVSGPSDVEGEAEEEVEIELADDE